MSRPVLYKLDASPPATAVRMLAEIIGLELETKDLDVFKLEHKSPEFLKLNPMGTIPTLQDGDFIISESHAIIQYLLLKYGTKEQQEQLYPSDLRTRALINQYLFFDTGVFYARRKNVVAPIFFGGAKGATEKGLAAIDEAFTTLEAYLGDLHYLVGDRLTIADVSLGATAASMRCIHTLDPVKFPRVARWLARLEQKPFFKLTLNAVDILIGIVNSKIVSN
uniref:Glutathione S-transferase epsilon1 n=1 Tax=Micromelalopha troglodyta TaxID=660574 RepID=A0A509ZM44_9NEOP|nr:glutathione S-transferase epsilon1 [Micromelalopha troglodyta]